MKKSLVLSMALSLLLAGNIATASFAQDGATQTEPQKTQCGCCHHKMHHPKMTKAEFEKVQKERKAAFEKRLKLTKKQKEQIEANRLKNQEEMAPIMNEMKAKFDKIHQIKTSNLAEAEKTKQIEEVKKELGDLKDKSNEIRRQNMQEFENLLTDKQKTEFQKMKEERKAAMKHHKHPCPVQGGCPLKDQDK